MPSRVNTYGQSDATMSARQGMAPQAYLGVHEGPQGTLCRSKACRLACMVLSGMSLDITKGQ